MKIYRIQKVEKRKKKPKSHVGKMEGAYTEPGGSGKIDTRLTPVHRYTLEEKEKPKEKIKVAQVEVFDPDNPDIFSWYKLTPEEREKREYDEKINREWDLAKQDIASIERPSQSLPYNPIFRPFPKKTPRTVVINEQEAYAQALKRISENHYAGSAQTIAKFKHSLFYLRIKYRKLDARYQYLLTIIPKNQLEQSLKENKDLQFRYQINEVANEIKITKSLIDIFTKRLNNG